MDPPSGRVPEQGPDWFLVATKACGGRTPDLGYVLEVWGFIGEVGVETKSGAPREVHEAQGCALGGGRALPPWARPPISWTTRRPPGREIDAKNFNKYRNPQKETKIGSSTSASLCRHQKPIGTLFRHPTGGVTLTGGHLHHPGALHDEEGVVHPRG